MAPTFLTAGDFDDDGIPDLAVLGDFDNDVVLLRRVGDGTFAPLGTLPSGDLFPFAVAAADLDLDGDGRPDLAVADGRVDTVWILFQR